jgi:hypothetical protein
VIRGLQTGDVLMNPPRGTIPMMWKVALIVCWCAAGACDSPTRPSVLPSSCDDPGGMEHSGALTGKVVWRASDGPHRIRGSVHVDSLVVEAGALVCAAPDAAIWLSESGVLTAVGSPAAPIVFTGEDATRPWIGIRPQEGSSPGGSVELVHVRIDNAHYGIWAAGARIEDSLFRQLRQDGIRVSGFVVRTRIDSACIAGTDWCSAVSVASPIRGGVLSIEEVVIRHSGGIGVLVGFADDVTMHRVRIEGSAGVGVLVEWFPASSTPKLTASECDVSEGLDDGFLVQYSGHVTISGCNIRDNAGKGVRNKPPDAWSTPISPADARDNWWGDPAGPHGPAGDGVDGEVLFEPWRTSPVDVNVGAEFGAFPQFGIIRNTDPGRTVNLSTGVPFTRAFPSGRPRRGDHLANRKLVR